MRRLIVVVLLALALAGCASNGGQANLVPDYTFAFVVDGRVTKTLAVSAQNKEVSAVVQPRSGESPIWQNHGATYVHLMLTQRVEEVTAAGGVVVRIDGEVEYYRDMKYSNVNGNDEVTRGRAIAAEDVERQFVTVNPGEPGSANLAEGISVIITALPKPAPASQP